MKTYLALSRMFPQSFRAKVMTVVLVCTALPLLLLVGWLAVFQGASLRAVTLATVIGLAATLCGVLLALVLIYRLLKPLRQAVAALDAYHRHRRLPRLPVEAMPNDDMGRLLRGLQQVLDGCEEARGQLERHALEDPLTEALNRRGCSNALRASVAYAARTGEPFVLCVVDLDNLKRINDDGGHAEGDYALVSLARIARECCLGKHDWIGRWGGDEFMLGLHADPGVAMDRVRVWIEVLAQPGDGARGVEVSVGAATWGDGLDAGQLYRRADAAMYRAKFDGGRRLVDHARLPGDDARAEVA